MIHLIENGNINLIFEKNYEYLSDQHKIDFRTILKVNNDKLENSVLLHPIKLKELIEILEELGFKDIKLYGNFNKDQYNPMESFALVVVTRT